MFLAESAYIKKVSFVPYPVRGNLITELVD